MSEKITDSPVVTVATKRLPEEKSPNIMVIDDDQVLLDLFGKVLRKLGFRVALTDNGKDAVNLVRKNSPDVVLLDIKMPGMDGITALQEIKAQDPDIEVIIMTGFANLESAVEALKYGAFDYIKKPFDRLDQVVNSIRQAWERRKPRLEGRNKEASLERTIYELKVLYNLSRTLGYCSDGKELMAQLLDSLNRIVGYDLAISLWTEMSEPQRLLLQVVNPSSSNFIEEAKCKLIDAFNSVLQSKIPNDITFDRILGDENIKPESQDDTSIAQKVNSFLNVPLMKQKSIVGMINVSSHRDRAFSPDDIRLVYTAINQIPSALHGLNGIKAAEQSKIEKLAESMSEGVIMTDENFEVVVVNQITQNILGERNPTLDSIQSTLGIDLKKFKAEMEKGALDSPVKEVKIHSENYEVNASVIKGTAETFMGFVISLRPSPKK
jgi:CheY-like chemotaxis protein